MKKEFRRKMIGWFGSVGLLAAVVVTSVSAQSDRGKNEGRTQRPERQNVEKAETRQRQPRQQPPPRQNERKEGEEQARRQAETRARAESQRQQQVRAQQEDRRRRDEQSQREQNQRAEQMRRQQSDRVVRVQSERERQEQEQKRRANVQTIPRDDDRISREAALERQRVEERRLQMQGPTRPGVRPQANDRGVRYDQITRQQQEQLRRQRVNQYNQRWNNWQTISKDRYRQLERQRRIAYLRYQQRYWERLRRDQLRLQQARYYDNYYNNYRYSRSGQYYYTSQYGAQMLRDALQNGYEEGFYAGQADRQDGWGYNPTNSYGYQDAAIGYDSYYVTYDEYNYYFREGFRRGYEDGYYGRNQYGNYSNGKYTILGTIVGAVLDIFVN